MSDDTAKKKKSGMENGIQQRGKHSWNLFLGWDRDATGKRVMVRETFKGSWEDAKKRRAALLTKRGEGTYVAPRPDTVKEVLDRWYDDVKLTKRWRTQMLYRQVIDQHLMPTLGPLKVQALTGTRLTQLYQNKVASGLSPRTVRLHAVILRSALRWAVKRQLVARDVSADADVPTQRALHENDVAPARRLHVWSARQAEQFLAVAKKAGAQCYAFYRVLLSCGLRKGEIAGLKWEEDIDLDAATMTVRRQLLIPGPNGAPWSFGPTKTGDTRVLQLGSATVEALRAHRLHQNRFKMKNRLRYEDHGMVFAREYEHLTTEDDRLGRPLRTKNIGQRQFAALMRKANVPRIRIHDLRHTCASLLFETEDIKVVQKRLGHADVRTTLQIYTDVLPERAKAAAQTLDERLG